MTLGGRGDYGSAEALASREAKEKESAVPDADPPVSPPDTDRQYHIDLAPGEVADYILLPGDPDRTDRIAALLDEIEVQRQPP